MIARNHVTHQHVNRMHVGQRSQVALPPSGVIVDYRSLSNTEKERLSHLNSEFKQLQKIKKKRFVLTSDPGLDLFRSDPTCQKHLDPNILASINF